MALEALIAQRIASAAAQRARLTTITAPQYSTADQPLLAQKVEQGRLLNEQRSMGNEADAQALADAQAGVPEPAARLVADALIPQAPTLPTNIPFVGGAFGGLNKVLGAQRKGRVDALVSALGATGGAKLLAKLSMYTALFNANNRDALARLKLGADLADGTLGKPPAVKAPKPDISGDIGLINGADSIDAINALDLPNLSDPRVVAALNVKLRGLGGAATAGRFADRLTFDREKWAATLSRWAQDDAESAAARKSGDLNKAASVVESQLRLLQQDINRMEVFETDFNGQVTRKILQPEYYQELLRRKQAKEKELEQIKAQIVPPVPGASPPVTGGAPKRYGWIGGPSGTDLVYTDTPTAPHGFTPYNQNAADQSGGGPTPPPEGPGEYDEAAAKQAGAGPDATGHWPSKFKTPWNSRRFLVLNGQLTDTLNDQPATAASLKEGIRLAGEHGRADTVKYLVALGQKYFPNGR